MDWYLKCLKGHYADFNGRARRKEYWMFCLFNMIISCLLGVVDSALFSMQVLSSIYALAVLIPGLAVAVRRLHDVGKSGWMLLVALIPLIGAIWLLILFCSDSKPGANKWGPNPKGM